MNNNQILKLRKPKKDFILRRTKKENILFIFVFAVLVIHCITLLYPLVWMFLSSLKSAMEYEINPSYAMPTKWLFSNFADSFKMLRSGATTFPGMIVNSLWYTILATGLSIFIPSVTGYCISKYEFKLKGVIFGIAIACMTIPIVGSTASYYKLISDLGIHDTVLYVIFTHMGGFGGTFLIFYGFFKGVSWSYAEAVFMDGGGPFTVFFKIMLPQALPLYLTFFITGAIGNWNDYMTFILYLPGFPNLASGLYTYMANTIRMANYPVYYAGLLISIIPLFLLFVFFSNKIMTNMTIGGLKG